MKTPKAGEYWLVAAIAVELHGYVVRESALFCQKRRLSNVKSVFRRRPRFLGQARKAEGPSRLWRAPRYVHYCYLVDLQVQISRELGMRTWRIGFAVLMQIKPKWIGRLQCEFGLCSLLQCVHVTCTIM